MLLENKIALVTGASRGIGQGIALGLAREGAIVVGTATTSAGANHITKIFHDNALQGCGMVLDVTAPDSVEILMAEIKKHYGAPNLLINNAAITKDNLFIRMKEEEWLSVMDTNLTSVYRLTKACIRDMIKARFGRIINIGSVVGSTGNPGQVNYAAAKAGLLGFTKALALEVGSRDITVNAVAPGFIDTDMTRSLSTDQRDALMKQIPLSRMGSVEDIAGCVIFLASKAGSYITGQTLHVNGGMFMD